MKWREPYGLPNGESENSVVGSSSGGDNHGDRLDGAVNQQHNANAVAGVVALWKVKCHFGGVHRSVGN